MGFWGQAQFGSWVFQIWKISIFKPYGLIYQQRKLFYTTRHTQSSNMSHLNIHLHFKLNTPNFMLHTAHWIMPNAYCKMNASHCTMNNTHCKFMSVTLTTYCIAVCIQAFVQIGWDLEIRDKYLEPVDQEIGLRVLFVLTQIGDGGVVEMAR